MRIAIRGRNLLDLKRLLRRFPLELTGTRPELVISYGGDGALLGAEREFPGIPKLPLRDHGTNPRCPRHTEEKILTALCEGRLRENRIIKLIATGPKGIQMQGINDIVIHNRITTSAVRYRIWLDDELYANRVVGDGLVTATPFGSTGYYRSITHSIFKLGIGLAFNNSTEPTHHLVISDESMVRVEILRGPAVLLTDNAPARVLLKQGDLVTLGKSHEEAVILGLETFRCPTCLRLRQENPAPI